MQGSFRTLSSQTIGIEFASKIVRIEAGGNRRASKRIKLQLWDTAGTERFRSVSRSYYRGAAGAILVYDVASLASFHALDTYLSDIRALASKDCVVILVGNKSDVVEDNLREEDSVKSTSTSFASIRQDSFPSDVGYGSARSIIPGSRLRATKAPDGREVSLDVASRWASQSGIPVVLETSALNGENVEEVFSKLARTILARIELGEIDPDNPHSGIQYGDSGWTGLDVDDSEHTLRRRAKKNGVIGNLQGFGDVFHKPGGSRCC